tara:strand:- start:3052 stop:4647 length:1596 start_codon:yes stop_codon:yes gene_type:complete
MATYERYMNAARNADAAGDEAAARQLVQAAMAARSQTTQEPEAEEGRELFGSVGEVGGSALAGAARGALGALELPEMALRGIARTGQEVLQGVGLIDEGNDIPVLNTFTGRAIDAATEAAGVDELIDYRGDSRAAGLAGTIGEFGAGGGVVGGIGKGAKVLAKKAGAKRTEKLAEGMEKAGLTTKGQALSTVAATGSEVAGQATEGTNLEPYARVGAALLAPTVGVKTTNFTNKTLNMLTNRKQPPTVKDLKTKERLAYKEVDEAGPAMSGTQVAYMVDEALNTAASRGAFSLTDKTFVKARKFLKELEVKAASKGGITLAQYDKAKRKISDLYNTKKGKKEPFLIDMMKTMENEIAKVTDKVGKLKEARQISRRANKAKILEKEVNLLQNQRKVSGSGGNVVNSYRRSIQKILDNPTKISFFDDPEIRAMQQIVDGRVADNILRLAGKMAPSGNGLMAYMNIIMFSMNPAFLGLSAASIGAKALGDARVRSAVKKLQDTVKLGGSPDKISRDEALELLASQGMLSRLGQE